MQQVLGPVEYLIVAFEGNHFKGEIVPALTDLLDQGLIRILDLAVISKDLDGNVLLLEASELTDEISQAIARLEGEHEDLLSEDDLLMAAEGLENNTTAAAMLFENVWAARFAQSIRNANGQIVVNVRIPNAVIEAVGQSLRAAA
jgi:hypothetical protein